jgi:acyl-CoA dehydrogenase
VESAATSLMEINTLVFGDAAIFKLALLALALGYLNAPLWLWSLAILNGAWGVFGLPFEFVAGLAVVLLVFNVPAVRRALFTGFVMKLMKSILPKISETEKTALDAGVIWSEAELFSGRPNFKKLMDEPYPRLTPEEQAFMNGPVEKLCSMLNDWEIWKNRELPKDAFQYMKDQGFLGMIIPKEYGGLQFSAMCNSEVVLKISSRSIAAGVTVMVPNSLGPAELLIHYGTDAQKKKLLPRLAKGLEVPCFGLTEPAAGSDAGSITSEGVLFKNEKGEICIRLNWQKRWITLAAISTVIGLAFRLRDPENILGRGEDLGITCALVPSNTPGVMIGRRHDPLGVPFYNCPTEGHNVVVNAEDAIVGGTAMAGKGWQMLMECLAAGRGISLPAQAAGGIKLAAKITSAHASVRKQFGVPIGRFEGVEEPLARIFGANYFIEAMRRYTISALDQGIKPPVVTAIAKFNATEWGRKAANDAMDVMGGAGISMGPRNTLAIPYIAIPIGITVEGANILTRTLIIFGQGALRAHPFAYKEVDAAEKGDLPAFDRAFFGHIGHVIHNMCRSVVLSLTRGYVGSRGYGQGVSRYFQKMDWASASFGITADLAMALLGGSLKFKEKITGRFADILSWMYIGTAVLSRYKADGFKKSDLPFVQFSMDVAFHEIQRAFEGIYQNMDVPLIGWFFRNPLRWWSNLNSLGNFPADRKGHKIVSLMLDDAEIRARLTEGLYVPKEANEQVVRLERAYAAVKAAEAVDRKLRQAVKAGTLPKMKGPKLAAEALKKGVLSQTEFEALKKAEELRWDAIQVDDFSEDEYHQSSNVKAHSKPGPVLQVYGK